MSVLVSCSKIVVTHELENEQPVLSFIPNLGNIINVVKWNHNSI